METRSTGLIAGPGAPEEKGVSETQQRDPVMYARPYVRSELKEALDTLSSQKWIQTCGQVPQFHVLFR